MPHDYSNGFTHAAVTTTSDLELVQWNIRNMGNISELRSQLEDKKLKPHLLCLQETWLKNKIPHIPNYKVASFKHRIDRGGGVLTYIRNDLPFTNLDLKIEQPNLEYCATTIYLEKDKITILNCYDPPESGSTADEYQKVLDLIPTKNFILVGDLNAHDSL